MADFERNMFILIRIISLSIPSLKVFLGGAKIIFVIEVIADLYINPYQAKLYTFFSSGGCMCNSNYPDCRLIKSVKFILQDQEYATIYPLICQLSFIWSDVTFWSFAMLSW